MDAAENLLVKAARALASGDLERMDHFVGLAARLNYDPHEETDPAAYAVHMMLFDAVVDALEESEHGDARWLDAAVEVMGSVDGWGQSEMRHSLLTARQDYQVDRQEHRAIEAAVADVPERSELYDVRLPHDELKEAVVSVLVTLQAYRAALESRSG